MATFQLRLKEALGPKGYDPVMRRSVQTALLYEAQRCIKEKLPTLRPFQRKIAHYNQLLALVQTLDFIRPHHREEILWRTGASKETMSEDVAWKRCRAIDKDLSKIAEKVKPLFEQGMSHSEACDAIVQKQYESVMRETKEGKDTSKESEDQEEDVKDDNEKGDKPVKERPPNFEVSHNHNMMTFRMYYKGPDLDPDFPPPKPPIQIVVPADKPQGDDKSHFIYQPGPNDQDNGDDQGESDNDGSSIKSSNERQKLLAEVKEHLELLKQFEGAVPEEDLNQRKRELFLALPPAPPPLSTKKVKMDAV